MLSACFFVFSKTALAVDQPDHLWHFDECEGAVLHDSVGAEDLLQNVVWTVGKWQCAINQSWQAQYYLDKTFTSPLPAGELTLLFYWRNSAFPNEGRNHFYLKDSAGKVLAGVRPSIYSQLLYFDGGVLAMPAMPRDADWHLVTISYGQGQLVFYLNGAVAAVYAGDFTIKSPVSQLEIRGENWPVEMDELVLWSKVLSASQVAEIYNAYNSGQPLSPYNSRPAQEKAQLVHLWHFDEAAGATATDSVGSATLNQNAWWTSGKFGAGVEQSWQSQYYLSQDLPAITSQDLSLEFWWQNSSLPNEGRGSLILQNDQGENIFGLRPSICSGGFYFNGGPVLVNNILPIDSNWHHLALVYDSYKFELYLYVDGQEKMKLPVTWFKRPLTRLVIRGENWPYKIDELAIWQGALSAEEVKGYYDSGQPHGQTQPDPVILAPGIMGSWQVGGKWELDPILHTYDNLWQALKNVGYEEGKTLFAFPYQWRLSNNYTATLLKQKIQEVKNICQCNKVDIVAHSMGGLVARAYVEGSDYANDIDQLIFLATPQRGATKAYLMWEGGEFGPNPSDVLRQKILTVEADFNGYGSLFQYVRQLPLQSVEELLPVYDYLRDKDTMALRAYPANYPVNTFLELLNNPIEVQKLNGVRMVNILADAGASSTIDNLRVVKASGVLGQWSDGYPENYGVPFTDHGLEYGIGDDTVPVRSNQDFANLENIIVNSDHSNIVTDAQKRVIKDLTGQEPSSEVRLNLFKKFFLVRIFSPADFLITAPNGQRLGKDFTSNQAVNEIPGAFYSGFSAGPEFAVIPDPADGQYQIELQGTGQGEYKLSSSLISDGQPVNQEFTGAITAAAQRDFTVDYSAEAENPLSELKPVDTTPPVVTISQPEDGAQYLHNDDLVIDYAATDDFSGLATTTITINDQALATTTLDLFDYSLGQHTLIITVVDKSGNQTVAQVQFEVIANIESTISDIKEIHDRGWLKRFYQPLLIGAFRLLDIETKYFAKEKELTEKLMEKTQNNPNLSDQQKQKLLEQYHKKLAELEQERARAIARSLEAITRLLDIAKRQNQLNQQGYDIMISDINYLRINL
jgi:triacylglycerol esterase/lipase EstA (alpha/beta hydrolase family)